MEFRVKLNKRNNLDKDLLGDLKKVAERIHKRSVTRAEYEKYGVFSSTTLENRFKTWTKALLKAGLEVNQHRNISMEQLLENIAEVWMKLGKQPTYNDFNRTVSKYSIMPYVRNFGSWNDALVEFSKYVNSAKTNDSIYRKNDGGVVKSQKSIEKGTRVVNYRLRFFVMKRDNFKCKNCGRSPATNPKIILHIDHIKPWVDGGETVLDNLQTLCSICNIGKSNLTI